MPFDGVTEPIDPEVGRRDGKYSWAKSPHYDIPGKGFPALESGPFARQDIAGRPGAAEIQDTIGSCTIRYGQNDRAQRHGPRARSHAGGAQIFSAHDGLARDIDLHDKFYPEPVELPDAQGFGGTEAARGGLMDYITLKEGKIENYQVVTPTAWNIGPRDGQGNRGPIELALLGTQIKDKVDPLELGIIARSFDSCLVCTVHAYDAKTGKELARYKTGAMT
jgi:Ni,Fe-hydrogenase I large subunit